MTNGAIRVKKPGLKCQGFHGLICHPLYDNSFCGQDKCKKDEDCTTLDDPKIKHKPPKCEKKKCIYEPYYTQSKS